MQEDILVEDYFPKPTPQNLTSNNNAQMKRFVGVTERLSVP